MLWILSVELAKGGFIGFVRLQELGEGNIGVVGEVGDEVGDLGGWDGGDVDVNVHVDGRGLAGKGRHGCVCLFFFCSFFILNFLDGRLYR